MQYDAIILELMSRIQKLEAEVIQLRAEMEEHNCPPAAEDAPNAHPSDAASSRYIRTTDEMIDACYAYGKRAYRSPGMNPMGFAGAVETETGMNPNSAFMYIYAVKCMLDGVVFKRAINIAALEKYLSNIYNEFGKSGLSRAINATRQHAEYRKGFGHPVESILAICSDYERRL